MSPEAAGATFDYLQNPVTGEECAMALEIPLVLANSDGTYTMELDLILEGSKLTEFILEHGVHAEMAQGKDGRLMYVTGTFNAIRSTYHKLYAVSLPFFNGVR